ncbi:MAG: restriction endonuclease subunit S [Desulfobacteraceae bacterium]|nr:restriction endonuclease subunit S [Desulfobacteraceae bacterium]MBC2719592.1 restriction endonuclease subunit S [Desulfobacteraceae bacterium]
MGEWKEKSLSDLAILYNDSWKVGDEECPYIALEHIEESKLRLNGIGHSDIIASNKYRFNEKNFLFGKLRPYFRKVVKPQFSGICSTDIWVVGACSETDLTFLFYLFANQAFVDLAYSGSSGTRMPRADWKFMKDTVWLIPSDIEEQRAIASVLSSLDDKIDLLHRQNKTLEAMAETLFRQWFVEEAQEDWEENSLLEVIQLIGGGTPKMAIDEYWDGDIPWLAGGDIASNHKSFINCSVKSITEVGLNNSSAKLLPKYATVISARGTVGKYCLVAQSMAFSQSNYGILPNPKISECFFFTYLLVNHVVEELQSSAYGSVFDTITTTTFKEIKVILPTETENLRFEQSVSPYFKKMFLNKSQIRTLEKLRDTLLPKLMSGEVRVKT